MEEEESQLSMILNSDENLIRVSFKLIIEGILDSVLLQVILVSVAKNMAAKLIGEITKMTSKQEPEQSLSHQAPPSQAVLPPAPPEVNWEDAKSTVIPPISCSNQGSNNYHNKDQATFVQPAQFTQLSPGGTSALPNNFGLIADVPLQVNVELGKASKTIKEILELGPGSVVELDRLAGEPVDMFVNGKLIAKCEVVVINETFGIRITEIVSPSDRIDTLN
jgi:flagellar motor switch protein FliN/FliY